MAVGGTLNYKNYEIAKYHFHASYDPSKNDSTTDTLDIELVTPIKLSNTVALAIDDVGVVAEDAYVGQNLIACGFGNTNNNQTKSKTLECTNLRVVPVAECGASLVGKGLICTYNIDDNNVCGGDLGGPAFVNRTGDLRVAGLISYFPDSRNNARCKDGHKVVLTQVGPLYTLSP